MATVIKIIVFLFALLVLLDSLIFENHIYYNIARDYRKNDNPELYDDTYLPNALWPQEGGSTFQASVSFKYKGKEYKKKRNIRCYQDLASGSYTNEKYTWRPNTAILPVSLDDGGLFYTQIPNICDRIKGLSGNEVIYNAGKFKYINNVRNPTYIESFTSPPRSGTNSAFSKEYVGINPNSVLTRATPLKVKRDALTSNLNDIKIASHFSHTYGHHKEKPTDPYILYSSVSGLLFFEEQWGKKSELVEFIGDSNLPIIVPDRLLVGVSGAPGETSNARLQVTNFLNKYELEVVNLNMKNWFRLWLHLRQEGRWAVDFANLGIVRAYRRSCEVTKRSCNNLSIKKEYLESDVIAVNGQEFLVSDRPAIYLPDDKIILRVSNSSVLTTKYAKD